MFVGLFATYLSLSPGTVGGMGYSKEEMRSGQAMLEVIDAWVRQAPAPPMRWSRHGPLPVLFDLPLLALSRVRLSAEFWVSLEAPLLTAGLLVLVYLWLRQIATSGVALLITLAGAFGTMLWPYAYIGLEAKQSFFLLLAGYLSLRGRTLRGWRRLLGFALVCGLAISLKSTGIVLAPAVAFLVYVQFREDWRSRKRELGVVAAMISLIWLASAIGRQYYWGPMGGGVAGIEALRGWIIAYPTMFFSNVIGLFGSPSKGLFVYAPILILALWATPAALREHRGLVIFAMLIVGCSVVELALLKAFADELWGPRYLHCGVAPLLLVIGAAYPRFEWRRYAAVIVLAIVGFGISFLGVVFHYSVLEKTASAAGQNTQEWLVGDAVWNPVRLHSRLFGVWIRGGNAPVLWTPSHHWVWSAPPGWTGWKTVNLREFAVPQPWLFRLWNDPKTESPTMRIFYFYLALLVIGPAMLVLAVEMTRRQDHPVPAQTGPRKHSGRKQTR